MNRPFAERGILPAEELEAFREGRASGLHEHLGARPIEEDGQAGYRIAVWAPNASRISVLTERQDWNPDRQPLAPADDGSGIWHGLVEEMRKGDLYKLHVVGPDGEYAMDKADPFALRQEEPPGTASVAWHLEHAWNDREWMETRAESQEDTAPISIYEVHLGSWRREDGELPRYREIAPRLADYALEQGFTHVELLPIAEHPFYGSWGYQCTGFFAPTARYGDPEDFAFLVEHLHQRGLGVILDWVPSHFPQDGHGLVYFDGTHLFEPADPRRGWQPEWNSHQFDYGRPEVRSFLISSACSWLERFHLDGLRVDAVASMLYLDYARGPGGWIPNVHGGRENLDAVTFLRDLNDTIGERFPDTVTVAEESTSWPLVSRPTESGGLGFGMKWDMGWMNDTLSYFREDPIHRRHHHRKLTFRAMYAFSERFCLPLSHDEVVHGKGSLLGKMPGDDREKFANLRLLFASQWAQPGKKLLFMGGEIAQWKEWNHDDDLQWELLEDGWNAGMQRWVRDLNRLYRENPALHERDFDPPGFEWVDCSDADQSVLALLRTDRSDERRVLVVLNFTPVARENYRIGVPEGGVWREILNSDAEVYGGRGFGNLGAVEASPLPMHDRSHSLTLTLPPLAAVFLERDPDTDPFTVEATREESG